MNNVTIDGLIERVSNYESNNFNSITKYDNSTPINARKPIKLYQDKTSDNKNNTTINLPGSYNFHQYFNTIINNIIN